jgi:hypothetical protein
MSLESSPLTIVIPITLEGSVVRSNLFAVTMQNFSGKLLRNRSTIFFNGFLIG